MAVVMKRGETEEVSYEGCVLYTYERNGYHDSDFYAVVWDEEKGAVRHVEYGTTRFPTYGNSATVDATDEAKAKAADYDAEKYRESLRAAWEADARQVVKGREVRFTQAFNGRTQAKVAKGTVGTVVWVGEDQYARSQWAAKRVGVAIEGYEKAVFVSEYKLEVTSPQEVNEDLIATAVESHRAQVKETGRTRHISPPGYLNAMGGGSGVIVALGG